ncbi:MAG: HvfB family MNIO-type RiPP peptide maturase [Methylophilus sp.]|uniref:HvfB family MNIO-type RiPP peptide maturase n=1 Tax=Methylophilus sp. TaxID=29541 RepID=UPI003FA0CE90
MAHLSDIRGVGLGLKRELIPSLKQHDGHALLQHLQFVEIAPENWIEMGGKYAADLRWFAERYPIACHGLCLSLGGPDPLNVSFLYQVKQFLADFEIPLYTEHLSYCSDAANGYIYDLLPIPFTEEAVHYVAQRIRQTQDILGQRIAVENASFYVAAPISEMDECSFINAVLAEADCNLHLDINNVYVNSVNFGFDAYTFIEQLPAERIVYGHIAGHLKVAPDLLVDTHGAAVIDPVWQLLAYAYRKFGVFPMLLERDTNIPPLAEIMHEVDRIHDIQQEVSQLHPQHVHQVV